jgi:anti-sigma-K factor RskA
VNIKEYIASGILEDYLLGLLSESEAKEVEHNRRQYPEIRQALQELEQGMAKYAMAQADPLPEGVADNILKHIDSLDTSGSKNLSSKNSLSWLPYLIALLFALGTLYQTVSKSGLEKELSQTQTSIDSLSVVMNEQSAIVNQLTTENRLLRDALCEPVLLQGTDNQKEAIAAVYRNPEKSKNFFELRQLQAPPAGKQYQLWALIGDQPQDMGVLPLDSAIDFIEFPYLEGATAFAVTLEPEGGSVSPTLSAMVLFGSNQG